MKYSDQAMKLPWQMWIQEFLDSVGGGTSHVYRGRITGGWYRISSKGWGDGSGLLIMFKILMHMVRVLRLF